jgi:peptidoglycan/xylan/chitin deacetylase (PgdA/CDA1 family)
MRPHHRRRRRRALAAVGGLTVLLVILLAGQGGPGGSQRRAVRPGAAHRARGIVPPRSPAAIAAAVQNEAVERTLPYTAYVRVAGSQHRELALTFDDGPGPYTPQIIRILERERVPATFFEVGVMERYFHDATAEIVRAGWTIGDHTFSHPPMAALSAAAQRRQLLAAADVLMRYGAPFPRLFRPPYGVWDAATLALLRRYRMLMVLWTVDTADYLRPGVGAIVHAALRGARPGAIILMHDGGGDRAETVAALPLIVRALRARGYRLVTVPQLLLDNPPPVPQPPATVGGEGG